MELLDPVRLRADEAAAEDVLRVAADRHHLPALGLDLETARGFAEWTGPVVRGHASGRYSLSSIQRARDAHVKVPARVVQRRGAPALAPLLAELPGQDRVRLANLHGAAEPRGEARQHDGRPGVPVAHPRARGTVERRPHELGPHETVAVAERLVRCPGRAEEVFALGQLRREDPEPVLAPGPADQARGEGVSRRPPLAPCLLRGHHLVGRDGVRHVQQQVRRLPLGHQRVAVLERHAAVLALDGQRRVQRRRRAERHLRDLGVEQLGHAPAGVAAVPRGRRPVEPGGDGEGVSHARAGSSSSASRRSSTLWKSSPSMWSWR